MKGAALLLAGISALAPAAALSEPVGAGRPASEFRVPDEPVVLTRTWRRTLPDGKEVVARRSYSVRFARDGDGYRVEGELVSSVVEAPPSLRAIAELEQARPDKGLFPIRLDRRGQILPTDGAPQNQSPSHADGAQVANGRIGGSQLSDDEKAQAIGFVQEVLDRGGSMAAWPQDLFHPQPGTHKVTRELALPGGASGAVTVSTDAQLSRDGSMLGRVDRVVQTDLGGDRRIVRETWTLQPLAGGF